MDVLNRMNILATPHCEALGFDDNRIRETLSLLGLNAEHGALADRIRTRIIDGRADEFVESCSATLERGGGVGQTAKHILNESFRQAWIHRLQCFGSNFDTAEYFEERFTLADAFARARIPLGVLQLTYSLTQELLISALPGKFSGEPETERSLISTVLKLTSLDFYLTAAAYRLPEVETLEESLEKSRKEASRLRQKTSTDELTGLANYGKLMESLEYQIRQAQQQDHGKGHESHPLCLILADLDFFKKINDTYGHVAGDLVLTHVAQRMRTAVRDVDVIGRFGGEEFVIIMINTDLTLATIIADRVRQGVMNAPVHVKGFNITVTISLGVAMLRRDERKEALLERADAAMYEAKRMGRNRVAVAPTDGS